MKKQWYIAFISTILISPLTHAWVRIWNNTEKPLSIVGFNKKTGVIVGKHIQPAFYSRGFIPTRLLKPGKIIALDFQQIETLIFKSPIENDVKDYRLTNKILPFKNRSLEIQFIKDRKGIARGLKIRSYSTRKKGQWIPISPTKIRRIKKKFIKPPSRHGWKMAQLSKKGKK